ncbi:hypothetical protein HHK36_021114 [Tetracentron sinense]|uniref:Uncharacterized protein n=1 Tax=Tetracentron sinense TaxID=13715 RepID=A0A834YSI4_TETSI|nr:hypothetical protein HHK36_021114 [Tetracentron sinense]
MRPPCRQEQVLVADQGTLGMGTELQYAVHLLATLPKNNCDAINTSDAREFFKNRLLKENTQRIGFDKLQDSMDRFLEEYNRESLRKTMLTHEEIFKDQVRELHRLYKVQKMMMAELRNKETKLHPFAHPSPRTMEVLPKSTDIDSRTGFWSPRIGSETDHSPYPTTQTSSGYNFHIHGIKADPRLQERSISYCGDNLRMPRGFDLEQPAEEDILTDVSAIEDQVGPSKNKIHVNNTYPPKFYTDGESEIELTLSIGCSIGKKKPNSHQPHSSLELRQLGPSTSIRSGRGEECSDPTNTMSTESATFDQERQHPPWLFQALSLNRTGASTEL